MPPGRNDLCPCGSGRKYKRCHFASDRAAAAAAAVAATPEDALASILNARDVTLGERVMRYARERYGAGWLQDVLERDGLLHEGGLSDDEMPFVIPWLEHCRFGDDGLTLAEEWSRQARGRLSENDEILLRAYHTAWVSLWEVAEVQPGTGSRLVDVLTREERFARDVRSSHTLRRLDTVLAMILDCDGISFFGGTHGQPLPPRWAEWVTKEARRLCRVQTRAVAPDTLKHPLRQLQLLALWNAAVDAMLHQPPPVLHNTDGDPLVLTRDELALTAPRDEVARRLASLPGAHEDDEEGEQRVFVVTRGGNAMHASSENTIVARLALSATRLTVETNSARRADAMRRALEEHLPGMLRFRLRKEENTARMLAEAREREGSDEARFEAPLPHEEAAAVREFRARHLRGWIDEQIPALGGFTPREAARRPAARARLAVLLKELEQSEERLPPEQRIDVRWLHDELGPVR